jgi:hypothetical protein
MNQDIHPTVLTTAKQLNLEYWEAFILHENSERVEQLKELRPGNPDLAEEFACLLKMI